MARKYKRLNYEDRKAIEAMCKQGKRAEEIAEAMDVHRATIYHELKRGGAENGNRKAVQRRHGTEGNIICSPKRIGEVHMKGGRI